MSQLPFYNDALIAEARQQLNDGQTITAFETLTTPLHEALYKAQSFDFLDELNTVERVALSFDYIRTQVEAGGFIQLIQNGYVSLILTVIEGFQELNIAAEMGEILDNVLKVYVLNVEILSKETSVNEFARLYDEFKEFDMLEESFNQNKMVAIEQIIGSLINTNE